MIVVSTSGFGFEPATKTEPGMMKGGRFSFQSRGGEGNENEGKGAEMGEEIVRTIGKKYS